MTMGEVVTATDKRGNWWGGGVSAAEAREALAEAASDLSQTVECVFDVDDEEAQENTCEEKIEYLLESAAALVANGQRERAWGMVDALRFVGVSPETVLELLRLVVAPLPPAEEEAPDSGLYLVDCREPRGYCGVVQAPSAEAIREAIAGLPNYALSGLRAYDETEEVVIERAEPDAEVTARVTEEVIWERV